MVPVLAECLEQRLLLTSDDITVGPLNTLQTVSNSVLNTDADTLRLHLTTPSTLNAAFSGLSKQVRIQLVQDLNGNNQIDNGETLELANYVSGTFNLSEPLAAGDYVVRISLMNTNDSTNYTAAFTASAIANAVDAGNNLASARSAGTLTTTATNYVDVVQWSDADLYTFQLGAASNLTAAFTGLSEQVQILLVQDLNGNNQVDGGEVMETANYVSGAFTLSEPLATGKYYIQVVPMGTSDNTSYTLSLSAAAIANAQDAAGNLASARSAGTLTTTATNFVDVVQWSDADVYTFQLAAASNLTATFTGLSEQIQILLVQDLNGNDQIDSGEVLETANYISGTFTLLEPLATGKYFIQIVPMGSSDNTAYTVTLSANAIANAQDAGNLLGTARNAGQLTTTATNFVDVIQNGDGDDYRFQLSAASNLTATFTGLSEQVQILLVQDLNNNNVIDSGERLETANYIDGSFTLLEPLAAGQYFIQMLPMNMSVNTAYTLTLSAIVIPGAQDAGNGLGAARNVGPLTRSASKVVDVIQYGDVDVYRFQLSATSLLTATLTGLSEQIQMLLIQDINGNQQIDSEDIIKTANYVSGPTYSMLQDLVAGNYFIQISPMNTAENTSYTLSLNSNIPPQPPTISGFDGSIAYAENQNALVLDSNAIVSDVDSLDFDTGSLTVGITANADSGDRLEIANQGTSAGQIGVSGSNVTFGGTVIGTFTGGTGNADLVVTLNSFATLTAVQALLRNVTYRTISESPPTATRTVRAFVNDGDGGTSNVLTKTISVTSVNDAPIAQNSNVTTNEDTARVFLLSDFHFNDPEQNPLVSITVSSLNLATGDTLTVDQGAGQVSVTPGSVILAARIPTLTYTPASNSNGVARSSFNFLANDTLSGTVGAAMTINVTSINDAPTNLILSAATIAENNVATAAVGTLSALDADTGTVLTYSLVGGTGSVDNGSFTIFGNTLRITSRADFESKDSYSIRVRAADQNALTTESIFTISVSDVNEAPSNINLSSTSIMETNASNATIGILNAVDQDAGDAFTYSLVTGTGDTDNASFSVTGNSLTIIPVTNFSVKSSYSIRLQATDLNGLSFAKQVTINVTKLNEAPSNIVLSSTAVAGNLPVGTVIGTFTSTDADANNTFTYSFATGVGDSDNASFAISNGQLRTSAIFHSFEKSSYSILVRTTDQGGLTFDKPFTITVTEGTENPTDIALSSLSIAENRPGGTVVGTLSSTDPNTTDTFTYALVAGPGSTNNSSFTILNDQLRISGPADFEAKTSYSILIRTMDQTGLTFDKQFTILVLDANDAPTDISLDHASINENAPAGTIIGTFNSTDPDNANSFTYALVSGTGGTDNSNFTISNGQLISVRGFDFETKTSYSIRVRTTDQDNATTDKVFVISVTDGNDRPTNIVLTSASIAENRDPGTVVGTFGTTDSNAGDTFSYSLITGNGGTDNDKFAIENGQLKTTGAFDFETRTSYSILVQTVDLGGLTFDRQFTINVTNANDAPTDLSLSNSSILENRMAGTTVGTFSTSDPDVNDVFTYALVSGTGSTDNGGFTIVNGQLKSVSSFNFEVKNSYAIRVRTSDQSGQAFEKQLTITVTDLNDPPNGLVLTGSAISENLPVGTIIGRFSSSDADANETFTYLLVDGTGSSDNAGFSIVNDQLRTNGSFDFETLNSYTIRVRTTDQGGLTLEKQFTIQITNVNDAPTNVTLDTTTVAENQTEGSTVGFFTTTDQDAGSTFTYALVEGAGGGDNSSFTIEDNRLLATNSFDFETRNTYSIRVRTTDPAGLSIETALTINVSNVNEVPSLGANQGFSIAENSAVNATVGAVASSDPDQIAPFNTRNFRIVSGNTGNVFAIDSTTGQLSVANPAGLDFEISPQFTLQIALSDGGGGNAIPAFVAVQVIDVNELPTISQINDQIFAEDGATGALSFHVDDAETLPGELIVQATSSNQGLIPDVNVVLAGVNATRSLVITPLADQFGTSTITLSVSDGVNVSRMAFVVTATSVPDTPTLTGFASQTFPEDGSTAPLTFTIGDADTQIGNLTVTATSSNQAVVANAGCVIAGTDAARTLVVMPVANQSGETVITVTVSDGILSTSQQFSLSVTSVDDPTSIVLNSQPLVLAGAIKKPVQFDGTATIVDTDTPVLNFGGSTLRISGQARKDQLSILKQGGISTRGKNLMFEGQVIGTFAGGKSGVPLTVRLNSAADQAAVRSLIRSIGFKPGKSILNARSIQVQITEFNGPANLSAVRQIEIRG